MKFAKPGPIQARSWTPVTAVNGALAFALELATVAALCYWGVRAGGDTLTKTILAVAAPAAAITVWGLFLAAGGHKYTLPLAGEIALKLAVLLVGALALYATGHKSMALGFAALSVVSVLAEYSTK